MSNSNEIWSPLTCLPIGPTLSPSGLLQLDSDYGEVELVHLYPLQLRVPSGSAPLAMIPSSNNNNNNNDKINKSNWMEREGELHCTLTTHRIIFMKHNKQTTTSRRQQQQQQQQREPPRFIHLSNVKQFHLEGGTVLFLQTSSPKITLNTYSYQTIQLVFQHSSHASQHQQDVYQHLQKAHHRKSWEESQVYAQKQTQKTNRIHRNVIQNQNKVGVDAILTKTKLRHEQAKQLSEDAFSGDIERLFVEAKELVGIIQKYVVTLDKQNLDKNKDTKNQKDVEDQQTLTNMLQNMGMTSALSKKQYKDSQQDYYYDQLARQMSDFLLSTPSKTQNKNNNNNERNYNKNILEKNGGMMTLTDVYCLFNRARATNFISPEDVLQVLPKFKELKLGLSSREFPSGVVVIQLEAYDDSQMAQRLLDLCSSTSVRSKSKQQQQLSSSSPPFYTQIGMTALEAGRCLSISTILVTEHLLAAERMGVLCRDVTLEGTRFFPNYFVTQNFSI